VETGVLDGDAGPSSELLRGGEVLAVEPPGRLCCENHHAERLAQSLQPGQQRRSLVLLDDSWLPRTKDLVRQRIVGVATLCSNTRGSSSATVAREQGEAAAVGEGRNNELAESCEAIRHAEGPRSDGVHADQQLLGRLPALALAHVACQPEHADRAPFGIPLDRRLGRHPPDFAVWPDDPEFDLATFLAVEHGAFDFGDAGRVLRMDEAGELSVGGGLLAACEPEDRAKIGRPHHLVAGDVPFPDARLGLFEGQLQPPLRFGKRVEGSLSTVASPALALEHGSDDHGSGQEDEERRHGCPPETELVCRGHEEPQEPEEGESRGSESVPEAPCIGGEQDCDQVQARRAGAFVEAGREPEPGSRTRGEHGQECSPGRRPRPPRDGQVHGKLGHRWRRVPRPGQAGPNGCPW
jgi:hypothetical protein